MKTLSIKLVVFMVFLGLFLTGCGDSGSVSVGRVYNVWQNPFMSQNPNNNAHCDSYLTDTYNYGGPNFSSQPKVSMTSVQTIKDPTTGADRTVILGECATHAFDGDGNIQTICAGLSTPGAIAVERGVVTIDHNTLKILAFYPFQKQLHYTGKVDFGGAGYFYQDNQYRMVVAMPDGHVKVLRRTPSAVGGVDGYTADADYNVCGTGGALSVPSGLSSLDLYAVVPDKSGNIWFTTAQGVIGTITPGGTIRSFNINDPNNTGQIQLQPDGGYETIANSHCVDEGDNGGNSGAYILTTYRIYRFSAGTDGTPKMDWSATYDRGTAIKSGQVSQGSGTSPTMFRMGNRRFVTIADNATYMNVNVYRAEVSLLDGEKRLFAQIAPFGQNAAVSNENSLIAATGTDGNSIDIYTENNYGNNDPNSTAGTNVTQPGFARMNLKNDGTFTVASVNNSIAVPSLVSKMSISSNIVYTYNKTADGWYITGLDGNDLNNVRFTAKVGEGKYEYNNFYAAVSLGPDGKSAFVGVLFGLLKVEQQ